MFDMAWDSPEYVHDAMFTLMNVSHNERHGMKNNIEKERYTVENGQVFFSYIICIMEVI